MDGSCPTGGEAAAFVPVDPAIPMQTGEWLAARARLKFPGRPKVLTVDVGGHRLATAMLCETRFGLREMPLMNEPSDFFWRDEAALGELVDRLLGERKPFFLERLPAQSPTLTALRKAASGKFWLRVEPAPPTPTLDTESRTINELVKSGRRSDLRRAEKRLSQCGTITYELRAPTSREDLEKLIADAFDVETRSWKHDMGTALTSPDEATYAAAFRGFLERAHAEGHIRFAFVRLDGQAIAMQIASEWRNRYWIYKATFDQSFAKSSPGSLLYLYTLEQAIRKGLRSYEFMGKMDSWTSAWTEAGREYVKVYGLPHNLRGLIGAVFVGYWKARPWIRARLATRTQKA